VVILTIPIAKMAGINVDNMPRCSFCKHIYEFPRGLTLVLNDGNILYFCSGKCRKNMLHLKRDNKKVRWIKKDDTISEEDTSSR